MKVDVENLSSVKKVLHIEIPEDEIVRELDTAYQTLKKKVKIKGFRPGKAPRNVLERLYKKDVHADVISRLIQNSFVDALKEADLNIVGDPKLDPPELDEKRPYKYDATVEIKPAIENVEFKGLALKKNIYSVSDEEIDAQLKMLQRNLTKQNRIDEDRPVREGDFVLIDYEGFKDGKPFAETQKTENFTLKIGDGHISVDFDEKLIGMKPGDTRDIVVHFPEDYFNNRLANLEITFQVSLHEIRKEVLPEIDDEFATRLGPYKTLDELKRAITDNLEKGYAKRSEQELNEQIFQALIAQTDFELPDSMVDYELQGIIADAERTFSQHNMSMENLGLSKEKMSEKYRDTAEKQVRRHLILDRIIEQENLTLSDEEVDKGIEEMSATYNHPLEEIKNYYRENKDKLEIFKHALLEKRAIKLIIENGSVEVTEAEVETKPESEKMTDNA
ncbi:trigger factor [Thermodesulfobacteriota bacterium]